ncbi:hypothetical protein J7L67_08270 [bacterium]|nr:hypothetical protein [bacterium]
MKKFLSMKTLLLSILLVYIPVSGITAEKFVIDNFEAKTNALYSKSGIYSKSPSEAKKGKSKKQKFNGEKSLFIAYKKMKEGWCGYYVELKTGTNYFDSAKYGKITFMVKGKRGEENFQVGLADKTWFEMEDSVKSDDIGNYLPEGKITTQWQKAEIPLKIYVDKRDGDFDLTKIGSIAICFETSCFPDGTGKGVIYIDDLTLE